MTKEKANRVYGLLVNMGGANESERGDFVFHHTKDGGCDEWRFGGLLGFGGKYRSNSDSVDCYTEDETPERASIISELNNALQKDHHSFSAKVPKKFADAVKDLHQKYNVKLMKYENAGNEIFRVVVVGLMNDLVALNSECEKIAYGNIDPDFIY